MHAAQGRGHARGEADERETSGSKLCAGEEIMSVMIPEYRVRMILKEACEKAGSQHQWALKNKLSPAYVSEVIRGTRAPGDSILKVLNLKKVVMYHYDGQITGRTSS